MKKIHYSDLNAKQKENYNFQKIASELADYGYSCMWLNDDWQGADFIANHIDGETFLRVQLKSRLTVNKKYYGKNVYMAFRYRNEYYLYPHDELLNELLSHIDKTDSWMNGGGYSWNVLSKNLESILEKYKIRDELSL